MTTLGDEDVYCTNDLRLKPQYCYYRHSHFEILLQVVQTLRDCYKTWRRGGSVSDRYLYWLFGYDDNRNGTCTNYFARRLRTIWFITTAVVTSTCSSVPNTIMTQKHPLFN